MFLEPPSARTVGWAPSLPSLGPPAALTVPLGHLESKEGGGGGGTVGWAPSLPSQGPSAALTVPLGHLASKEGGGGRGRVIVGYRVCQQ